MFRSYKDALLSTSHDARKNLLVKDGRLLLNKTHALYAQMSLSCATLEVLLEFCDKHCAYITKERETAALHEATYIKLIEFHDVLVRSKYPVCRCVVVEQQRHPDSAYARRLATQIRKYRTLPGVLLPVYVHLYKTLGTNDVVKNIMSFVTLIP